MLKRLLIVAIILAFLLLVIGVILTQYRRQSVARVQVSPFTATIFSEPRPFPHFTLTDDQKRVFTNANFADHWTLMFFGFTYCKSICPTTLAELAQVFRMLPEHLAQTKVQVVFVTVDPEHDSPERLRSYLNSFSPSFIGVTGEATSLEKLRRQVGILVLARGPEPSSMDPGDSIDHSGTILLINPKGEYVGVFSMPHEANAIIQDLVALIG